MKNFKEIMNFARHLSASRTNLSAIVHNEKCNNIGRKQWPIDEDDDEETASLRRLSSENRELLVQLDATREALFNHQRKTQDSMENIEEEMDNLKRRLSDANNREIDAWDKVRSLEMALQEMQSEKQLIQKTASHSLDELLKAECQKYNELQEVVSRLNRDLESKEEDNIRLRMTIIKVQEDLTKENHLKDAGIELRDSQIINLKSELADLRLKGEVTSHSETKESLSESSQNLTSSFNSNDQDNTALIALLKEKIEDQEFQLTQLKEENQKLKESGASKTEYHLQNGLKIENEGSNFGANEIEESGEVMVNGSATTNGNGDAQVVEQTADEMDESEKNETIHRLQLSLHEAEDSHRKAQNRADHMTYLLNQKLIELNKLQLTLSGQTKEMIQLEKAYFQLKCHLSKGYRSSTPSSRNSSRVDLSTT